MGLFVTIAGCLIVGIATAQIKGSPLRAIAISVVIQLGMAMSILGWRI
jgi:hypothetical protein